MNKKRRREVWLVGAGPGDPGLLTMAAAHALRTADAVYHDSLVSDEILRTISAEKRFNVGKRGGRPSPTQNEINRRLWAAAKPGRKVVRLKGGDPFLFGRGGEEADVLRKKNIAVSVIPGISSGMAAAAYAGFPLTDRRFASSVTFVTASPAGRRPTPSPDFRALVRLGGTWVFFMGLKALPTVARKLIRAGADPRLPAAVISKATTARQRVVTAPLSNISDVVLRHQIEPPALAVVGRVVSLRPPPLAEMPVLVMRPKQTAGRLTALLRKKRAEVTEIPVLEIDPLQPNPALDRALDRLPVYDWILLTSANAVRLLKSVLFDPRLRAKIGAIGPGTLEALSGLKCRVELLPKKDFRAEGLAEIFLRRVSGRQNIFLPQAAGARDVLAQTLRTAGHRVDAVPIYRTVVSRPLLGKIRDWVRTVDVGLVPLSSATTADAFFAAVRGTSVSHLRLVSIGPVTTGAAVRRGFSIAAESPTASLTDLVETLETVA